MPSALRITVLGSGTSSGVPSIGCDCAVCRSTDPRDRRTRPSILIEIEPGPKDPAYSSLSPLIEIEPGPKDPAYTSRSPFADAVRSILVDTSTDLREQALTRNVRRVDAILFTHSHADHVMGLDDVRRYNQMQRAPIPCYADGGTLASLRRMFAYVFDTPEQVGGGLPQLALFRIAGPFSLGGAEIVPVPLFHGRLPILGFRVGAFAYLTDCSRIPDESWPLLTGVRTVILDALRHRPHPTHFSVSEAIDVVARLGAERAYFTHIAHDLGHAETCAHLPRGVELAYDGLVLEVAR
ncbi:MAG: MBL fold metallo-hydrolase [Acidobacteria bacterium]|nr:MBL fold metallo-hydrolase [Acidobacteriota bacterium]